MRGGELSEHTCLSSESPLATSVPHRIYGEKLASVSQLHRNKQSIFYKAGQMNNHENKVLFFCF